MYLLLAFAYHYTEWHIPPLIPFSTINNISMSVKRSRFTLVFFKVACHANPGAERNFAGSSLYILIHIFLIFQIHQLTKMYHFEHIQIMIFSWIFYVKIFTNFLCVWVICISYITMLHWVFPNHLYIHKDKHLFSTIKLEKLYVLKNRSFNFSSNFCW